MANELSIGITFRAVKGFTNLALSIATFRANWTGSKYTSRVQIIGNSAHEELEVDADITTRGWMVFRNVASTGSIEIGVDTNGDGTGTFIPFASVASGQPCLIHLPASTRVFAKATSGNRELEYTVLEA
jgi:hypothetical protein